METLSVEAESGDQGAGRALRPTLIQVGLITAIGLICAIFGYLIQNTQNRIDAEERFAAISKRVSLGIIERMHRYEYGLRGARGVAASADGQLTRAAFSRYATTRQIDREFPGARGFGIVLRVPQDEELAFVLTRRQLDTPDFQIRQLQPHDGDRFVITFVEPEARNREAVGLDIGSEPQRREAALRSAETREATLTPPLTLVQASGKRSGGMLLLLPLLRHGPSADHPDRPEEQLVGWSYAPLLIEDVLAGLDSEDTHYELSLFDPDYDADKPFYVDTKADAVASTMQPQRVSIPLYGRRWEAVLRPTPEFLESLHQQSPVLQALQALLLGAAIAALVATVAQLAERTRGQRLELARRAAIVEGSSDAIIVQNLDGVITDWNEGAERLFGYTKAQAKGHSATELLLPRGSEEEDANIRETVASGGRVTVFETTRRDAQGHLIPVSITASAIRDDKGQVVGAAKILRDGREAKAAEQRMRELNASLEDQVRERTAMLNEAMREARGANEAKSRFLANISHEIRTPMNAVIGMAHLLSKTRLDGDQAGMLERIRTAGKSLLALLNDVLDLSKSEAGEMVLEATPFRLQTVVTEITSIAEVSAQQRGIQFVVDSPDIDRVFLVGDRTRLGQIILNLITNAIKFTMEGRVTLRVAVAPVSPAGTRAITLRVEDTGIGIAEDIQPLLFRPFVQADTSTTRRFGGTGLGLSIVRQLVELMGGTISLHSVPGEGSEFEVALNLPVADNVPHDTESHAVNGSEPQTAALRGRRILVVDDNALNREVAARILGLDEATVVLAVHGADAVEKVRAEGAHFDAVLMDVQMPVMDGLEATRQIRALPADAMSRLPVIGLTAGVSVEERALAQQAGMDTVVGKPFDPDLLVHTLVHLLRPLPTTPAAVPAGLPQAPQAQAQVQAQAHPAPEPATAKAPARATVPAGWPDLEGFDTAAAYRRLTGDVDLLRSMALSVRDLLIRNTQLCGEATPTKAPTAPQWQAHAAALHDLKSMAGSLGATAVMETAGRAERLLRAQDLDEAMVTLRQLDALGTACVRAVERQWPEALAAQQGHTATTPPMSQALEQESGDLATLLAQMKAGD